MATTEEAKGSISTPPDLPRASSLINDNYCITMLPGRLLAGSPSVPKQTMNFVNLNVNCRVAKPVHTALGLSQKKESRVSRLLSERKQIKILVCQKCFLCHSIVLCKTCNKCQKCCLRSACRVETAKLLANLAGSGCRSKSSSNAERGLHPPLSDLAKTHKVSHSHKLLCQSPKEPLPAGGITSAYRQKRSRASTKPNTFGLFQLTIFSPKTQQVETYTGPEQTKSFPQGRKIQNGDTGNHQGVPPTRGVGHLNRLQGPLLPYTNTGTVQEISEILCPGSDIPIQSSVFQSVHSTLGVHCSSKGGETDGHTQGCKNPPVPR